MASDQQAGKAKDKKAWLVTIKYPDGKPVFTVLIECEAADGQGPTSAPSNAGATDKTAPASAVAGAPEKNPPATAPAQTNRPAIQSVGSDGEPRMTEPQKRYLFRLLAQQGIEGKRAEDHLKDHFKVQSLRDVSKAGASQLIEQMVGSAKGGGNARA